MHKLRWPGGWWRSLTAILVGNAIYFASLPYLPRLFQHEPLKLDWGLLLDLGICALVYGVSLRLWPRQEKR